MTGLQNCVLLPRCPSSRDANNCLIKALSPIVIYIVKLSLVLTLCMTGSCGNDTVYRRKVKSCFLACSLTLSPLFFCFSSLSFSLQQINLTSVFFLSYFLILRLCGDFGGIVNIQTDRMPVQLRPQKYIHGVLRALRKRLVMVYILNPS